MGGCQMLNENGIEAFVLRTREPLNAQIDRHENTQYDNRLQIWMNQETGRPLVLQSIENSQEKRCSDFGETIITRTLEGADQPEVIRSSEFGETLITETREGVDQAEVIGFSEFGETRMTATREGIDQAEVL